MLGAQARSAAAATHRIPPAVIRAPFRTIIRLQRVKLALKGGGKRGGGTGGTAVVGGSSGARIGPHGPDKPGCQQQSLAVHTLLCGVRRKLDPLRRAIQVLQPRPGLGARWALAIGRQQMSVAAAFWAAAECLLLLLLPNQWRGRTGQLLLLRATAADRQVRQVRQALVACQLTEVLGRCQEWGVAQRTREDGRRGRAAGVATALADDSRVGMVAQQERARRCVGGGDETIVVHCLTPPQGGRGSAQAHRRIERSHWQLAWLAGRRRRSSRGPGGACTFYHEV